MNWNGDPTDPHRYDDILGLPHHVSEVHPRMTRHDRAAQFAPFAALTGLDAAMGETARRTEQRIVLGNGALRMSAAELEQEVLQAEEQIRNDLQRQNRHLRSDAMRQAFEGREEA